MEEVKKENNNKAYVRMLLFDARLLYNLQEIGMPVPFVERDYAKVTNENIEHLMNGTIKECNDYVEDRHITVGIDFREMYVDE